jgi:hypothetical protein
MKQDNAPSVTAASWPIGTARSALVREPAGPYPALRAGPECLNISEAGRADVYCFTVPATGNFELANGMIALQCGDDWRYACMSRPYKPPLPVPPAKPRFLNEALAHELFWPQGIGIGKREDRI